MALAGPAVVVTCVLMPLRPVELNASVRCPVVPAIARFENAAIPSAFLVRYVTKEHDEPWVRGAAWGALIGLGTTIAAVFGSLWRDAESAIDAVMMAPRVIAVVHTVGAVVGGFVGMMAARALHAAHGGRRAR